MANGTGTMFTLVLEWIWAPIIGVLFWLGQRLIKLEHKTKDNKSDTDRKLAVDQVEISNLKEKIDGLEQKNTDEHSEIKEMVRDHHSQVISLLTSIKNGNSRRRR